MTTFSISVSLSQSKAAAGCITQRHVRSTTSSQCRSLDVKVQLSSDSALIKIEELRLKLKFEQMTASVFTDVEQATETHKLSRFQKNGYLSLAWSDKRHANYCCGVWTLLFVPHNQVNETLKGFSSLPT